MRLLLLDLVIPGISRHVCCHQPQGSKHVNARPKSVCSSSRAEQAAYPGGTTELPGTCIKGACPRGSLWDW